MNFEEIIATVFSVVGLNNYLVAIESASRALEEYQAIRLQIDAILAKGALTAADIAALNALQGQLGGVIAAYQDLISLAAGATLAAGLLVFIAATKEAIQEVRELYAQIANVRDLTGGTGQESFDATALARVAGISDAKMITDLLRMNRALFNAQGQAALGRLGIPANPNLSGLDLFNNIADKLSQVPAGPRKAKIEQDIFGGQNGGQGLAALLPLLRMTQEQRRAVEELGQAYDQNLITKVQELTTAQNLAGTSFQVNVIQPLVSMFIPVLTMLFNGLTAVFDILGKINNFFHGVPAWVTGVLMLAFAFASVVITIGKAIEFLRAMNLLIIAQNVLLGIRDALMGPIGWASLAVAGGIAATAGIGFAIGHSSSSDAATDKFSGATDKFADAVNRMDDSLSGLKGHGIPRNLTTMDITAIAQRISVNAIG